MAAKRSARPPATAYRCLAEGLCYPLSLTIRDRIRKGEKISPGQRGERREYAEGARIVSPPSDLIEGWLKDGMVEPMSGTKDEGMTHIIIEGERVAVKGEEVTADGTQG